MSGSDSFRAALEDLARGDARAAAERLRASAGEHALYAHAVRWLEGQTTGAASPYERADGFPAYRLTASARRGKQAAARALAERLDAVPTDTLLDLGCGDGEVLALALAGCEQAPELTLIEPSEELLAAACERLARFAPRAVCASAEELAGGDTHPAGWDLVVATWSLQNLSRAARTSVLAWLRARAGALLLAEFDADVPDGEPGSEERVRFFHERYSVGVGELDELDPEQAEAAAQAFLMPILFGALTERASPNHEQPIGAWARELERAGFESVAEAARAPHWWSEACVLLAT